jgi:hypothetical protein
VFGTTHDSFQAVLDRAGHGERVIAIPRGPASALLNLLGHLRGSPPYPWIHDTAAQATYVSVRHIDGRLCSAPRGDPRKGQCGYIQSATANVHRVKPVVARRARRCP